MIKLSILCLFIAIASYINHIDDTDETYGYWEPLHFLSYGIGMQTWEYCPEYAIRSYAFVIPFLPITYLWKIFNYDRIQLFIIIKGILGLFFAFSSYLYLKSIKKLFGTSIELFAFLFLITSPGIFFSSTAYLPSAVCSSLIMYSFSSWLNNQFLYAIFFGCIAVLWSGWPFVGVIFLPIGLDMLYSTFIKQSKLSHLFSLIFSGILIVLITGGIALFIDSKMYGKITFPPLNIALYNAFGGTGDELYGVEPTSYYIINLLLMLGPVTFLLSILFPFLILLESIFHFSKENILSSKLIALILPAFIWLGIMFSRPHKEERFLYPIYPILITMASYSIVILLSIYDNIVNFIDSLFSSPKSSNTSTNTSLFKKLFQYVIKPLLLLFLITIAFATFVSRVHASYRNYGGYMKLWKKTSHIIESSSSSSSSSFSSYSNSEFINNYNNTNFTKVCMGGDWYTFPSHFFLPTTAKLHYVEDNFHGLLPQSFPYPQGSSIPSVLPVNDQNQEETSRYIDLQSCDYIVATIPSCLDPIKFSFNYDDDHEYLNSIPFYGQKHKNDCSYDKINPLLLNLLFLSKFETNLEGCEQIIDPIYSTNSLGKAYSIPNLSSRTNTFKNYCLYKVIKTNMDVDDEKIVKKE